MDDEKFNIDDFVTLDEVGADDDEEEAKEEARDWDGNFKRKLKSESESEPPETEKAKKDCAAVESVAPSLVGREFIRPVTLLYCDVCKVFLKSVSKKEKDFKAAEKKIIASHCNSKVRIE